MKKILQITYFLEFMWWWEKLMEEFYLLFNNKFDISLLCLYKKNNIKKVYLPIK